jgi:SOS response associated peptidase (SRAP)
MWPTETAPVIRRRDEGVELVPLRWGFPPRRPKGAPVINFRSEGRRFPNGRCLIPASHFFEFTGARPPKSKWKFTKTGEDWFCFAGLCRPMPDADGDAFTLLTTEPGPDVAPIHDRQMVVLERTGSPGSISPGRNRSCSIFCLPAPWPSNRSAKPASGVADGIGTGFGLSLRLRTRAVFKGITRTERAPPGSEGSAPDITGGKQVHRDYRDRR